MGSAYPTIAADAIARFQRLRGRRVAFVTGTDEHGEKIALAAAKRGMEPKEHCDDVVASYKQLWKDVSWRGRGAKGSDEPPAAAATVAEWGLLPLAGPRGAASRGWWDKNRLTAPTGGRAPTSRPRGIGGPLGGWCGWLPPAGPPAAVGGILQG